MKRITSDIRFAAAVASVSVCLALLPLLPQSPASADDEIPESVAAEVADYTSRVEETAREYDAARAKQLEIEAELRSLDTQIAVKEAEIPKLERRAAESAVAIYKNGDSFMSLVEIVLESDSIADAINRVDSYTRVMDYYTKNAELMKELKDSLDSDRNQRSFDLSAAQEATEKAEKALDEAKEARKKAVEEAIARQKAEEEAAARAAARSANSQHGSTPGISAGEIDWNVSKDEFVNEWSKRIDAYLDGSDMAGCGDAYAIAAWNYGVDPRWAPAISCIESGKGSVCFRQYNAWGYGGSGFGSWEDGIDTVVKALGSSLYGGYISYSAAQTYCPPNADYWYTWCCSEMNSI